MARGRGGGGAAGRLSGGAAAGGDFYIGRVKLRIHWGASIQMNLYSLLFQRTMSSNSDKVFDELLKVANSVDPPKRERKVTHEIFIKEMLCFLKEVRGWRSIKEKKDRNNNEISYQTFYYRFCKWRKNKVFETTWKRLVELYAKQQLEKDPSWFKELYLDSTMVKNVRGHKKDDIGKNYKEKGHKGTKLSMMCDKNKVPLSCVSYASNIHDIHTVEDTLESIVCPLKTHGNLIHIVGADKGYQNANLNEQIEEKMKFRIVHYPKKNCKNKKKTQNRYERRALKHRTRIENMFCRLDQFRRIHLRQESGMNSYKAFNFLALAIMVSKHLR